MIAIKGQVSNYRANSQKVSVVEGLFDDSLGTPKNKRSNCFFKRTGRLCSRFPELKGEICYFKADIAQKVMKNQ